MIGMVYGPRGSIVRKRQPRWTKLPGGGKLSNGYAAFLVMLIIGLIAVACGEAVMPTATPPVPPATVPPTARAEATATPPRPAATATPNPTRTVSAGAAATPRQPDAAAKRGGVVRTTSDIDYVVFDPHVENGPQKWALLVYEGLLRREANGSIEPSLAEKFEASPDGRVLTFSLRRGVKFHNLAPVNGREMTAADVVWSFQRASRPDPQYQKRYLLENIKKYEVVDRYTLKLSFDEPFAPQLSYLTHGAASVAPREVEDKGGDFSRTAIGTGPMVLTSVRLGVSYTAERNPAYWDERLPYFNRIEHLFIPDASTQRAAFRTGQLDVLELKSPTAVQEVMRTNPNTRLESGAGEIYSLKLKFNDPLFNDRRVRYAISLATDRQQLIQLFTLGTGQPTAFVQNAYPPFNLATEDILKLPGYRQPKSQDIAEAKRLLAEAGYPNGFTTPCATFASARGLHEELPVYSTMLETVGIRFSLDAMPFAQYNPKRVKGEFRCMYELNSPRVDVDEILYSFYHTKGGENFSQFSVPEIDQAIEAQRRELDPQKRAQLAHQLIERLAYYTPMVSLYERPIILAVQPWVVGFTLGAGGRYYEYLYRSVWLNR